MRIKSDDACAVNSQKMLLTVIQACQVMVLVPPKAYEMGTS